MHTSRIWQHATKSPSSAPTGGAVLLRSTTGLSLVKFRLSGRFAARSEGHDAKNRNGGIAGVRLLRAECRGADLHSVDLDPELWELLRRAAEWHGRGNGDLLRFMGH